MILNSCGLIVYPHTLSAIKTEILIKMDILQKKGLEIAERTRLGIINSEIEDWENGIEDLNKQIKKLEIQRAIDSKRLHLWKLAKYYKEKYSKSKSRPTGADN